MSDRLLYQSEAERLVLERGLVDAEREVPFFRFLGSSGIQGILASVSFWPLLIIESVARMCFSRTNCSLSRFHAKGKLDSFNCKTGVFLRLFTSMFTKESNYSLRFWEKKINSSIGNI